MSGWLNSLGRRKKDRDKRKEEKKQKYGSFTALNGNTAEAIHALVELEHTLSIRQQELEGRLARLPPAKSGATVRRRRQIEEELLRVENALTTAESQRAALDTAQVNAVTLSATATAAAVLHEANEVGPDAAHKIIDSIADYRGEQNELTDALSRPTTQEYDDEDLDKELEKLSLTDIECSSTRVTIEFHEENDFGTDIDAAPLPPDSSLTHKNQKGEPLSIRSTRL